MLEELYKYHDEWLAIAVAMTSTKEDAEDLVQDMYIRLNEKLDSIERIRHGKDDVNRYFVYLTIRNLARDNLRKRRPDITYVDYIEELDRPEVEHTIEVMHDIDKEVESWHWYEKTLFNIYMRSEKSMRDIANESGISLTNIFHTIKKCKQRLKDKINDNTERTEG
jgi:RNA polymerase sigma factor (sigma-70 family)